MDMVALAISILEKSKQNHLSKQHKQGSMNGPFPFFKPMKNNNYSPKVSIPLKTIDDLMTASSEAIKYSFQTETLSKNNSHEHIDRLRKTLEIINRELKKNSGWISLFTRVQEITEELDEIVEEDQNRYLPDQDLPELHDDIQEYILQAEEWFNADPTDQIDPFPITADERLNEAWEQKMEAKG